MEIIVTLVIIAIAVTITVAIATVISKYSINLEIQDISRIVGTIVSYVNQKFVTNTKLGNSDHKLTEEQARTAFDWAFKLIKNALNDTQIKYLTDKYSDIDTALDIIIESVVGEKKNFYIDSVQSELIESVENNCDKEINWENNSNN